MLLACIRALKEVGFILDLSGHPVTAHFWTPTSMPNHLQNLSILFNYICRDWSLLAKPARSLTFAAELSVTLDDPKVYPLLPLCIYLSSCLRKMINRYGLRVSHYIVSR